MRLNPLRMAVAALELRPNIVLALLLSPQPDRPRRVNAESLPCRSTRQSSSIAPTTRLRRSTDKDLAMHASLLSPARSMNQNKVDREFPPSPSDRKIL
jgi:hypothetical protein